MTGAHKSNNWTPEEIEILRVYYNPKQKDETLDKVYKLLNHRRTKAAILRKSDDMGLFYDRKPRKPWTKEQLDFIHDNAESMPVRMLTMKLNQFSGYRNMPLRSLASVQSKCYELGYNHRGTGIGCEYFNASDIADVLGCYPETATKLLKDFKDELQPEKNGTGNEYLVKKSNLSKFIKEYPGEVAKLNPNIVLLITVLS